MSERGAALCALLLIAVLAARLRPPAASTPPPASVPAQKWTEAADPAPDLLYAAPVFVPLDVPMSAELQQFAARECAAADPPVELETVLAIIEHESGFDPAIIGHNSDGTSDYGLMQINSSALPLLQEEIGIQSMDELLEPRTNLQAGIRILSLHMAAFPGDPQAALMAYQSGAAGAKDKLGEGIIGTDFSREIERQASKLRRRETSCGKT